MNAPIRTVLRGFAPLAAAALLSVAGCPVDERTVDQATDNSAQTANSQSGANTQATQPAEKPHVLLDRTLQPTAAQLDGIDGSGPRPLAALTDSSGIATEFVANELVLFSDDDGAVESFVTRWKGTLLASVDARESGIEAPRMHLVRIDPAAADLAQLDADLAALNPDKTGELRVGSEAGMGVLAAFAAEQRAGTSVAINFVARFDSIVDRNVREGTSPSAESIFRTGYNPDPYTWPYFALGTRQDIGVAEAWTLLDRAGKLNNKINLAVVDGGFSPTADMPANWRHVTNTSDPINPYGANEMSCTGGSTCNWHGMNVVNVLAGQADNGFGAAGVAGPVAGQVTTIRVTNDVFTYTRAYIWAAGAGARIVNMSFSARVPATLTLACVPFNIFTSAMRRGGILVFAAAGNDGADIDAEDCFIACWEEAWYMPAENDGVIAVGALDHDSRYRRSDSNYGAEELDIFAPGYMWVGDDPAKPYPHVFGATSGASPFAAGVAALIWAANPALSADDVERILMETAHPSPDGSVRRYVNAFGGVLRALGNAPPELRITAPDPNDPGWRGFGGRSTTFSAQATDLEDGTPRVTWTSSLTGFLGEGSTITVELAFGRHVITATAIDSRGATFSRQITLELYNAPPRVEIVKPADGLYIFAGQRFILQAWSWDPEAFRDLPDDRLVWTDAGTVIGRGRSVEAELATVGTHTITLTGTDADGATATSRITVTATPPPANYPPAAEILDIAHGVSPDGYDAQARPYWDASLVAYAWDRENGYLNGTSVVWTLESNDLTWDIQLGEIEFGTRVRRRIYGFGSGRVTVTVTDRDGNSTTASQDIRMVEPPR